MRGVASPTHRFIPQSYQWRLFAYEWCGAVCGALALKTMSSTYQNSWQRLVILYVIVFWLAFVEVNWRVFVRSCWWRRYQAKLPTGGCVRLALTLLR